MQSSPPPPAPPPHGAPASDEHTQYSLDLDALTLDGEHSDPASPSLHQIVDKIASDDIDGPTDFTVNLGSYLRGAPRKQRVPSWQNGQDMFDAESAEMLSNHSGEDEKTGPVAPRHVEQKRATLQPTVEDYYSELTPARPSSGLTFDAAPARSFSTSTQIRSDPTGATTLNGSDAPNQLGEFRDELHHLREARAEAEKTIASLRRELESERGSRSARQTDQSSDLELLRTELQRIQARYRGSQDQLNSLQTDLEDARTSERDATRLADERAKELDQMHDSEDAEIHTLRVQLDKARDTEQNMQLALENLRKDTRFQIGNLQDQLEHSQNSQLDAESALEQLREQYAEHERSRGEEVTRLQHELATAEQAATEAAQLLGKHRDRSDTEGSPTSERQVATLQNQLKLSQQEAEQYRRDIQDLRVENFATSSRDESERELKEAREEIAAKDRLVKAAREEAHLKAEDMTRGLAEELEQAKRQLKAQETRPVPIPDDSAPLMADSLLQQMEAQLKSARDELSALKQKHVSEQEAWNKAEDEARSSVAAISGQHRQEQEARQKAEDEARALKEEVNILQQFNRLDSDRTSALSSQDHATKIADSLRNELQALQRQLHDQERRHVQDIESLRRSLEAQRKEGNTSVKDEYRRTIDLIEEGMASLRASRDELRLRYNNLEPELELTKSELRSLQFEFETAQRELAEAHSTLETTQSELEAARTEAADSRTEAEVGRRDLAKAKLELEDLQSLNEAFDARLSASLLKREDGWRARLRESKGRAGGLEDKIKALEADRETMAKALMGMWGREEFGPKAAAAVADDTADVGDGQKFKYRFARS